MKPSIKIALGLFTALAVMAFIVAWELVIKDRIDSVEVVVAKADVTIQEKEPITEDMIAVELRAKKDLIDNVIYADEMKKIIGEDTSQLIVGNSMISADMVDFDELVPDESKGEAIRPIPNEWIYAMPGSLRRKDLIDLYLVDQAVMEKQSQQIVEQEENEDPEAKIIAGINEPILKNVRVLYAKDSGNNEVVTSESKQTSEEEIRLNASGQINALEIILNDEDFQKLSNEILKKDKRLYVTYN